MRSIDRGKFKNNYVIITKAIIVGNLTNIYIKNIQTIFLL